jgi:hypothetical protein
MAPNYATRWKQAAPRPFSLKGKVRLLLRNRILSVSSIINKKQEENYLRCLYCHYVFDDQKEDFDRLILRIKNVGQFIDTTTCLQMLQGNKKIDQKYFHLSFDDGFKNHLTNAIPVLQKHKIPAIFFVPSSLIGANWDLTRKYCMETMHYREVIEMLSWNEIREMISLGFEIGSHTRTHARFSAISRNRLLMEDEILGSKKELEANIGRECKFISWPYGKLLDADNKSLEMVKAAGYNACFGAYRGSIHPMETDIFRIPRHEFEVQWPTSHIMYFVRGNMELRAH